MSFQEEQEYFLQQINEHFISLFDLVNNIQQEHNLKFCEANLFLLTKIDAYIGYSEHPRGVKSKIKQICFELVEPPFLKYSLDPISSFDLIEALKFASKNGRFRSEKNAKKYGLLKEEIKNGLSGIQQDKVKQTTKKYDLTERDTHLQMIAILAEELANKSTKYRKSSGHPNHSALAELLNMRAQEIEIESLKARSVDGYRRRLTEISKFYKGD